MILVLISLTSFSFAQVDATIVDTPDATVFSGTTMGPIKFRVTLAKTTGQILKDVESTYLIATAIKDELGHVNQLMSTYIDDSDVSRFNQHDSTEWLDVSEATAEVVHRALEISRQTEGAFDITVGPLVDLWNFGPVKHEARVPSQSAIDEVLEIAGYDKIQVRLSPPALSKTHAKTQIDLSAIAKGFAVDQVGEKLSELGYNDFLVEVGGEVRTSGKKKDGEIWMVGIMQPSLVVTSPRKRVPLSDKAMATSGDYQNFFQIDDQTYSHTIDPKTGWPIKHSLTSVSIVANDCMTADAWATAVNVMGPELGKRFCDKNNIDYFLMSRKTGGGLNEVSSSTFPSAGDEPTTKSFSGILFATLAIFLLAVGAMAIGVIFSGKRIKGSCGGIASLNQGSVSPECSVCSQPSDECSELREALRKKNATSGSED